VAALRILGLRGQFLDLILVYPETGTLVRNTETLFRERAQSIHYIGMLLSQTNVTNKPRMSNEYPVNTTQTWSLMYGVDFSCQDCGLG
jgi:hypothetical protein